ncbi:hypothetical protein AB6N24_05030 [Cellulomonas sp. 179-A 4D5 NHS]|uniref:hypothetical protein n=1 Tax=Cellulomonas sp. 179-A 4D5 NHS TaxID=3142378 RepID=UPI0039A05F0D
MQYRARELQSDSLTFMAIAMQPEPHPHTSHDPASWEDFLDCERDTREGRPLPSPFLDHDGGSGQPHG